MDLLEDKVNHLKAIVFSLCFFLSQTFIPVPALQASWWVHYPLYKTTLGAFIHAYNKTAPQKYVEGMAEANWISAQGNWPLARRLAAKEAVESRFLVLAALPEGIPLLRVPRSDCMGSHYNLLAQEFHKLGTPIYKDWYFSDDFEYLKDECIADPAFGTWIVAHAYVRKVYNVNSALWKKDVQLKRPHPKNEFTVAMDIASHWWQTGYTERPTDNDSYLYSIRSAERYFDFLVPGAPSQGPAKNIRRKR